MVFYANNVLLTEVLDDTFSSGGIGLVAGSFSEGEVVVHFDNLKVRPPANP